MPTEVPKASCLGEYVTTVKWLSSPKTLFWAWHHRRLASLSSVEIFSQCETFWLLNDPAKQHYGTQSDYGHIYTDVLHHLCKIFQERRTLTSMPANDAWFSFLDVAHTSGWQLSLQTVFHSQLSDVRTAI